MAKYLGLSVVMRVNDGSGFAVVGQVLDITGPTSEFEDVDVTTRDTTDFYREFLSGLSNPGELTFEIVFDPALASHISLLTLHAARTSVAWKLTWPTATAKMCTFSGYVKAASPAIPLEGRLTCNFTVKISGGVTWTAVAA